MLKIPRRVGRVLVAISAGAGAMVSGGIGTARAEPTPNVCVVSSILNTCLNDWNNGGRGNHVAIDEQSLSNENFTIERITGRCANGYSTPTCPFNNNYFNNRYKGYWVVQIRYTGTNLCLASYTGGIGLLGNCNDPSTGKGGDIGTVFVWNQYYYMINLYWTNQLGGGPDAACLKAYGVPGDPNSGVDADTATSTGCDGWEQG